MIKVTVLGKRAIKLPIHADTTLGDLCAALGDVDGEKLEFRNGFPPQRIAGTGSSTLASLQVKVGDSLSAVTDGTPSLLPPPEISTGLREELYTNTTIYDRVLTTTMVEKDEENALITMLLDVI